MNFILHYLHLFQTITQFLTQFAMLNVVLLKIIKKHKFKATFLGRVYKITKYALYRQIMT